MKILHTADWHLGKTFNNYPLLEEQSFILDQLMEVIKKEKPDLMILAGDIYDRSVPPAEAVELFDKVMSRIVFDMKVKVIAIAGNHDSPERINYCNYLLKQQGLHIFGRVEIPPSPVILEDEHGEIYFYPIPYTEPETLRYISGKDQIRSHQEVMEFIIENIRSTHPKGKRAVFIGHAFIAEAQGDESESERPLLVGGAAHIPASLYDFFDYTALGHLHKPLSFLEGKVKYSGSILKYSFSESAYDKSLILFDLDGQGKSKHQRIPLKPRKDVLRVRGQIIQREFKLEEGQGQIQSEDFLEVSLQNEDIVPNAMQIVQKHYPNAMILKWPKLKREIQKKRLTSEQIAKMSEKDLFKDFYQHFTQKDLDPNKEEVLNKAIQKVKKEEE